MSVAHDFPSQTASRSAFGARMTRLEFQRARDIAMVTLVAIAALWLLTPDGVSAQARPPVAPTQQAQVQDAAVEIVSTGAQTPEQAPARKPVRVIEIWKVPAQQGQTAAK